MACFIVPAAEAIAATVAVHILESKEKKAETMCVAEDVKQVKAGFSGKVKWLSKLLWGGSSLLAFEHVWHGEVQPFFPFLTAAESPESFVAMLNEVSTVGVGMALTVTAAWLGMIAVSHISDKSTNYPKDMAGEKI